MEFQQVDSLQTTITYDITDIAPPQHIIWYWKVIEAEGFTLGCGKVLFDEKDTIGPFS